MSDAPMTLELLAGGARGSIALWPKKSRDDLVWRGAVDNTDDIVA